MKMTDNVTTSADITPFSHRCYQSLGEYASNMVYLLKRTPKIFLGYTKLPADFRERLMLTITSVNKCHYCQTFHTHLAKNAGISSEECATINSGRFDTETPEQQLPALEYARSWAMQGGHFNARARPKLQTYYSEEIIDAIELAIRGIWVGNLSGNTWDYCLYRLTQGRLGQ